MHHMPRMPCIHLVPAPTQIQPSSLSNSFDLAIHLIYSIHLSKPNDRHRHNHKQKAESGKHMLLAPRPNTPNKAAPR